jgi:hypothetical protein
MARIGKDVQDFVNTFLMGMRVFNGDMSSSKYDRDKKSGNDNSDLSRYEPGLAAATPWQKLFGTGEPALAGSDRGMAVAKAKLQKAIEDGDATAITKAKQNLDDYNGQFKALKAAEPKTPGPQGAIPASNPVVASAEPPVSNTQDYSDDNGPRPGADWSSLFAPTQDAARGGMMAPVQHAAIGGPMQPQSAVQSALPMSAPPASMNDDQDSAPTESAPDLNLPTDPEDLGNAAAPAVKAGLDRIEQELKPRGAVEADDPQLQAKHQAFASGAGRLSDDEVAQIDKVIDPDGKLTPAQLTAARPAAIHKFYADKGDTAKADEMSARALLYSKFTSDTRRKMAVQALQNGDMDNGIKLLTDAYDDVPNGETVKFTPNSDGTVNVATGFDKAGGFVPSDEKTLSRNELIQLASNTDWLTAVTLPKDKASREAEAKKAKKAKDDEEDDTGANNVGVLKAIRNVSAAAEAVRKAVASGDDKAEETARNTLQKAEDAALEAAKKNNKMRPKELDDLLTKAKGDVSKSSPGQLGYGTGVDQAAKAYYQARDAADNLSPPTKPTWGGLSTEPNPNDENYAATKKKADQAVTDAYFNLKNAISKVGEDPEAVLHGEKKGKERGEPAIPGIDRPSGRPSLGGALPVSTATPPKPADKTETASKPPAAESKRADGTTKGAGFFGPITRPDGKVSTEVSIGVNLNGKETEIPLMVPTLTKPELDYIINNDPSSPDFQKNLPRSIADKAVKFAKDRISQGRSPFADAQERPHQLPSGDAQKQPHQLPSGEILTPKDGKWMREPEFVLGDKLGPKPQLDARGQITALSPEQMKIRDQLFQTPRGREIFSKWATAAQDEAPRAPRQPRAAPARLEQVNDMIGLLQQGRGMGTPAQNRAQLQQLMDERARLQGGAGR